jgi:hypothetical protein
MYGVHAVLCLGSGSAGSLQHAVLIPVLNWHDAHVLQLVAGCMLINKLVL